MSICENCGFQLPLSPEELGRLGGLKRSKNLTPEERSEIARKAGLKSGVARRLKATVATENASKA